MMARVLRVALQGVQIRVTRSLLTSISLFVGVLAVVVISAGGGAAEQSVLAGSVLTSGAAVTVKASVPAGRQTYERAERACTVISAALRDVDGGCTFVVAGMPEVNDRAMEVLFALGDLRGVFPYPLRSGRWIASGAVLPPELVVNEAAASSRGFPLGSVVRITLTGDTVSARVVGVVFDGQREPRGFVTMDPRNALGRSLSASESGVLYAHAPDMSATALSSLVSVEMARAFDTGPPMKVERSDPADPEADVLRTITLVFSVVAGLSLLVGALGILNIGLATLKERSDELSLRRSFGATRLEVVLTIVTEGQIVALAAACLAVVAARSAFPFVIDYLAGGVLISDVSFPSGAALTGVAASCLAAFLGSLAPAVRAGRVPIASIMRV
ncbi:MAG: ABC transporter permease [Coriobacteriia bacterium]|nr:ABC transporter permease [Coriobacteriia bacterium]